MLGCNGAKFVAATLSYFCELYSGGGGEQTNYIFHMATMLGCNGAKFMAATLSYFL